MPKRRWRRRKHLYLILDDWSRGYSIRQVDLSSASEPGGDLLFRCCTGRRDRLPRRRGERRLPPAVFHIEAPRARGMKIPSHFTAAFGTKIIYMQPNKSPNILYATQPVTPNPVAVFDVRARALTLGRRPASVSSGAWPIYIPVGDDKLFALSNNSFHLLSPPPPPPAGEQHPGGGAGGERCAGMTWRELPAPPPGVVVYDSYAVHPDGRTIFVSIRMLTNATFSFHMPEEGKTEGFVSWRRRGAWMLPISGVHGPVNFDRELNAWVGMARLKEAFGHICACDVVPADPGGDSEQPPPAWKLSKEKVVDNENPAEKRINITLVYMGAKSRYCLVEYVFTEDKKGGVAGERNRCSPEDHQDDEAEEEEDPRTYMFRVTTFSLKLDENGDLTTGNSRRVRYYRVPEGISDRSAPPVAFWM